MLYSPTGIGLLTLVIAILLFATRMKWRKFMHSNTQPLQLLTLLTVLVPAVSEALKNIKCCRCSAESTSFLNDYEDGFSSSNFDLSGNIAGSDSRAGLDSKAKSEIGDLMNKNPQLSFDQARAMYFKRKMANNNISKYWNYLLLLT